MLFNDDTNQVAGFGWLNDNHFILGQYKHEDVNSSMNDGWRNLILKNENLSQIKYVKKERDTPIEDELPQSFAITLFHIIFMYNNNITVISKNSREIVYFYNFEKSKRLRGIQLDVKSHQLLAFQEKEKIQIASLKGEDQEAWKYFLKQNDIKAALLYCRTAKQKAYVSAIYANQLFNSSKYDTAASYYIQSGLSFESVCLKYLQHNKGIYLITYLQAVRKKLDKNDPNLQAQRMIICTWIAELMLSRI